jgi:hypothetical protein
MDDINLERALNDSITTISNAENNDKVIQIALNKLDGIHDSIDEQNNVYLSNQIEIIQNQLKNKQTTSMSDDLTFLLQRLRIINKHIKSGALEVPATENTNIGEVLYNMEKDISQRAQ